MEVALLLAAATLLVTACGVVVSSDFRSFVGRHTIGPEFLEVRLQSYEEDPGVRPVLEELERQGRGRRWVHELDLRTWVEKKKHDLASASCRGSRKGSHPCALDRPNDGLQIIMVLLR